MLNQIFKDQLDFDIYLGIQQVRMTNGYLTRSERETLKKMQDKNYKPTFIKEEKPKLPIVTDVNFLKQPCGEVTKEDNIKEIIQKLKDTLESRGGLGITANQIGIQKKISYIKIPKMNGKKLEYNEIILINTKIIEKSNPIKIKNEECLSLPGISVQTRRYIYITIENYNEDLKSQIGVMQDLESLVCQHEHDHQNGKLILDCKWRTK